MMSRWYHGRMRTCVVVLVALTVGSVAHADDMQQAEADFKEGVDLLAKGKLSEACEKFESSLKRNSQAVGPLLNAASCDEKRGKLASAAARYQQARDIARDAGQDEITKDVEKKLREIQGLLPHITITISQRLAGMKLLVDDKGITIDDKAIPVDGVGVRDLPIDPGDHEIIVSAPARLPFNYKFSIVQSETKTIAIPVLAAPVKNTRKTIGFIVGLSGIAAIGSGIALAEYAKSKYDRQFGGTTMHCQKEPDGRLLCDSDGKRETDAAIQQGNIATGLVIIGAAAIVTGGVLWFTAPKQPTETKIAITPVLGPDEVGFVAAGRF
jgi:tetratricopeptide (TPR) repeat protein